MMQGGSSEAVVYFDETSTISAERKTAKYTCERLAVTLVRLFVDVRAEIALAPALA